MDLDTSRPTMTETSSLPPSTTSQDPAVSNVTIAINYSLPELEQFVSHSVGHGTNRGAPSPYTMYGGISSKSHVKSPSLRSSPDSMAGHDAGDDTSSRGLARCVSDEEVNRSDPKALQQQQQQRRRTRRKITPKKVPREKSSVRYSMNLVPEAQRNLEFLHFWRVGEETLRARLRNRDDEEQEQRQRQQPSGGGTNASPQGQGQGQSQATPRRRSFSGTTTSTQAPEGTRPRSVAEEPAPQIGPGWTIRTVARADTGRSKSKHDKYFFSPDGRRFRSMAEVNKYKHDMERETGVDVGPAMKKPSRASSRIQKKAEEDEEESTESSTSSKKEENDVDEAAVLLDSADDAKDACETCQHFPFCSKAPHPPHHLPPSKSAKKSAAQQLQLQLQQPFLGDQSVIWVPSSRSEWDDCVDEMTAACYSAALRRFAAETNAEAAAAASSSDERGLGSGAGSGGKSKPGKSKPGKSKQPPHKPLSRAYIRDRIDIDDPIRGYQIRHRDGGWLQGFVLMTSFTTWTHYFKWDSTHPKSGMRFTARGGGDDGRSSGGSKSTRVRSKVGWDHDGSMSAELESQPRSGDPNHGGVVWPTIAEVSLVGALGCGEYLVRMALDDISRRDTYDYVVLQATDTSRTFYERFGFVRVGAVSKYGPQAARAAARPAVIGAEAGQAQPQQQAAASSSSVGGGGSAPLVGYRHWTYADESSQKLSQAYGGPSYMMALKIDRTRADPNRPGHHCVECGRAVGKISFLDALSDCFVVDKPKVMPLGGTIGRRKPASTWGASAHVEQSSKPLVKPASKPPFKPSSALDLKPSAAQAVQRVKLPVKLSVKPAAAAAHTAGRKRTHDQEAPGGTDCTLPAHRNKRIKLEETHTRSRPVTPLSKFEQAQYENIWLAVPPSKGKGMPGKPTKRKPPRPRGADAPAASQPTRRSSRGSGVPTDRSRGISAKGKQQQQQQKQKQLQQPKNRAPSTISTKRAPLRKQRIPPMYRDPKKVYYFNKVVTPKKKGNLRSTTRPYYFVLHYEEDEQTIQIIPLESRGTFLGRREGRIKWKATVVDRPPPLEGATRDEEEKRYYDAMGVITVPCDGWDIVPADSVHKCTGVAEDSWDTYESNK